MGRQSKSWASWARWVCVWATVCTVGLASPTDASAEASTTPEALAEAAFIRGLSSMKKKDYAAACVELARARELAPSVARHVKLAECEERRFRPVAVWSALRDALLLARATGDARAAKVEERFLAVDKVVPKLVIVRRQTQADAAVHLDGTRVEDGKLGGPIPLEAGKHEIMVSLVGHVPFVRVVEVALDGKSWEVVVPALFPVPPSIASSSAPAASAVPSASSAPSPAPAPSASAYADTSMPKPVAGSTYWTGYRIAGLSVGAAGVVTLAVGGALGGVSISKWNAARDACGASCPPDSDAQRDANAAKTLGTAATIAMLAGGAMVLGGTILWFVSPKGERPAHSAWAPWAMPNGGGLTWRGTFP